MQYLYSVIICSHNPREDYLRRTLESLQQQTLPREKWELLLIDNASERPLADVWNISWHPRGRQLRESELGLTPARLRGITESIGDILVFVDDDNVVAPDFLERLEQIAERHPYLGVFGSGTVEPEFEVKPPRELDWLASQHDGVLPLLALKRISRPMWSNNPLDRRPMPWGAGLCVRREIATYYLELVERMDSNAIIDRRGSELFCSGDVLFSWAAAGMGKGFGVFPELRVTHLIAAARLKTDYFLRLVHAWWISETILTYLLAGIRPRKLTWERRLRLWLSFLRSGRFAGNYKMAGARGEERAFCLIEEKRLIPLTGRR